MILQTHPSHNTLIYNNYTLIIVDHFSKWHEAITVKAIDTSTIAHAFYDQWICHYGLMKRLHSDGASDGHGCAMQEIKALLRIGKRVFLLAKGMVCLKQ